MFLVSLCCVVWFGLICVSLVLVCFGLFWFVCLVGLVVWLVVWLFGWLVSSFGRSVGWLAGWFPFAITSTTDISISVLVSNAPVFFSLNPGSSKAVLNF